MSMLACLYCKDTLIIENISAYILKFVEQTEDALKIKYA